MYERTELIDQMPPDVEAEPNTAPQLSARIVTEIMHCADHKSITRFDLRPFAQFFLMMKVRVESSWLMSRWPVHVFCFGPSDM
jgi:hypothetical protein